MITLTVIHKTNFYTKLPVKILRVQLFKKVWFIYI